MTLTASFFRLSRSFFGFTTGYNFSDLSTIVTKILHKNVKLEISKTRKTSKVQIALLALQHQMKNKGYYAIVILIHWRSIFKFLSVTLTSFIVELKQSHVITELYTIKNLKNVLNSQAKRYKG